MIRHHRRLIGGLVSAACLLAAGVVALADEPLVPCRYRCTDDGAWTTVVECGSLQICCVYFNCTNNTHAGRCCPRPGPGEDPNPCVYTSSSPSGVSVTCRGSSAGLPAGG